MTDQLKPCPFCGGSNVGYEGVVRSLKGVVFCEDCGAFGPHPAYDALTPTPEWNTRAEPEISGFQLGLSIVKICLTLALFVAVAAILALDIWAFLQ